MNKYKPLINLIEKRLDELSVYSKSSYDVLCEAERYSLLAGGKHLRALIVLQTALLGGISPEDSIDFACAVEMVHTYSLIHDDLPEMDNDDLRRGVPTCHKKFGADIALLAGDALLTKAFNIIATNSKFTADQKIECIRILSDACGEHGMLAGQTIDKVSENVQIDYETLLQLHLRKTGDMFLASIKIGIALSSINNEIKEMLENYIKDLGLAFQIKDDILDVTSSVEVLGKPINSDSKSFKSTFVSMLGIDKSRELLEKKVADAKETASKVGNEFFVDLADFFANRNM